MHKKNTSDTPLTSVYSLIILLVLLSFTLVIVYQFNSSGSSAQIKTKQEEIEKEIKFFNKTESFQIINNENAGKEVRLFLKNNIPAKIRGTGTQQR